MLRRKKRGQSTLEYVLLFAGLTLAILYGVKTAIAPTAKNQMDTAESILSTSVDKLADATAE